MNCVELTKADYYLFIDFLRPCGSSSDLSLSLFSHQELAIAQVLSFKDSAIFLKHEKTPRQGILRYVLGNPIEFTDPSRVPDMVRNVVKERGWHNRYSRNLTVTQIFREGPAQYRDHTGPLLGAAPVQTIWQAMVRNRQSRNRFSWIDAMWK